jgi:hypothetical protein
MIEAIERKFYVASLLCCCEKSGLVGKNLDRLAGQPIQIFPKNTKETPCKQSGLAKKNLSEKKTAKKTQKTQKTNYGRHPLCSLYVA